MSNAEKQATPPVGPFVPRLRADLEKNSIRHRHWLKFHRSWMRDRRILALPDDAFWAWIVLMFLCDEETGEVYLETRDDLVWELHREIDNGPCDIENANLLIGLLVEAGRLRETDETTFVHEWQYIRGDKEPDGEGSDETGGTSE
jgi:hypothetical protein